MRRIRGQKVLIVVGIVIVTGFGLSAQARSLRCSDNPVSFDFENSEGVECLCEAAKKAINFLQSLGLQTRECLTIKLADDIPSHEFLDFFGTYDPKNQELLILNYAATRDLMAEQKNMQGLELSKGFWCSFAAHELAHAVIHQNFAESPPSRLAEEYIAYVTQLMVLDPEDLERFLDEYGNVNGFSAISEMTVTYYLLDPQRFAVKCFRHYLNLDNPAGFVEQLLETSSHNPNQTTR